MPFCEPEYVIKPKDDLGLHWRIALALQADGWYLRVPKSAIQSSDQGKHIFLFSKSAKYFYDRFAVRPIPKARPTESSWVSQCIRAATSEQGCCAGCGEQMIRMTQKLPARRYGPEGPTPAQVVTVGWKHPGCKCPTFDIVPCRVLDPFSGMGTTVMEAIRLGRSAVGIDISQDNIEMSRARILHDAPLFNHAKQARA